MAKQRERGQEFAEDDLRVGDRRGHQQFDGAALALFGVNTHGQHRRKKKKNGGEEAEEIAHGGGGNVNAGARAAELHALHAHLKGLFNHRSENAREEKSGEDEEHADDDVGDRRDEVVAHFLAINGVEAFAFRRSLLSWRLACACAESSVVNSRKISSRLRLTPRNS